MIEGDKAWTEVVYASGPLGMFRSGTVFECEKSNGDWHLSGRYGRFDETDPNDIIEELRGK